MKKTIIILLAIILIGAGVYFFFIKSSSDSVVISNENETADLIHSEGSDETGDQVEGQTNEPQVDESKTVIGKSVDGRNITAYHYCSGDTELLFIGGIHGGYSWNTALVAYELMDYLEGNPSLIPDNVKVTVIPVLNPDGLSKVVGTAGRFASTDVPSLQEKTIPGRFNANEVDLNRNFDCDWQSTGKWNSTTVSGGNTVFSEPESLAIKNYVETRKPTAVVVWYSAVGGVFSSSCHNGILDETRTITNTYAKASGYPSYEEFDFYEITGDMVNWLAKKNIPAISVLLSTHEDIEWSKNLAGIKALLNYYSKF